MFVKLSIYWLRGFFFHSKSRTINEHIFFLSILLGLSGVFLCCNIFFFNSARNFKTCYFLVLDQQLHFVLSIGLCKYLSRRDAIAWFLENVACCMHLPQVYKITHNRTYIFLNLHLNPYLYIYDLKRYFQPWWKLKVFTAKRN